MSEWKSVDKELPEIGIRVLVYIKLGEQRLIAVGSYKSSGFIWDGIDYFPEGSVPVYWCRIPNGPEDEKRIDLIKSNDDLVAEWVDKPIVSAETWEAIPAWYKWIAMDGNGKWFSYEDIPTKISPKKAWINNIRKSCVRRPLKYAPTFNGNWEDSLVERPKDDGKK